MLKKSKTTNRVSTGEQGVALLFCLFALLILTAITTALIMTSGTETSVNANYRTEETAFFAAKTGIYEALDRMQQSNTGNFVASIPTVVPSNTGGVLYLLNPGSSLTVTPWDETSTYFDTEFCHEGYSLTGMTSRPPDVPCFVGTSDGTHALPSGSTWYTHVNSNYPWSGTSAAMPYEWVRINWKENKTESYLSGQTTPTISNYAVNSVSTAPAGTPVCWNRGSEVLLSTPAGAANPYTSCQQYESCGTSTSPLAPVYTLTALAVTSNGSRQMVQAEAALTPPVFSNGPCGIQDPNGFYTYGSTCSNGSGSPFVIGGGGSAPVNTDGYNSNNGTYDATKNATGGAIGSNGSVWLHGSSVTVGGQVYVQNPPTGPSGTWACPMDLAISGSPQYTGVTQSSAITPPTITIPANTSTTDLNYSGGAGPSPGAYYRNVSVSGNGTVLALTAPGTYNFNCLSVGSHATISINPPNQPVTVNITGNNCQSGNVIDFNSQAGINNTGVAANLQFIYPGTGNVNLVGAPSAFAVLIAPKASVSLHGGADFYGTILANTIDDSGNVALHFDHALTTIDGSSEITQTATLTGPYNILALHSLPY